MALFSAPLCTTDPTGAQPGPDISPPTSKVWPADLARHSLPSTHIRAAGKIGPAGSYGGVPLPDPITLKPMPPLPSVNRAAGPSRTKLQIQMRRPTGFDKLDGAADAMATHEPEENRAYVSFRIPVAGRLVSDSFMWPVAQRDVLKIKLFAVSLLADLFGAEFARLDPREIECKSPAVHPSDLLCLVQTSAFTWSTSSNER